MAMRLDHAVPHWVLWQTLTKILGVKLSLNPELTGGRGTSPSPLDWLQDHPPARCATRHVYQPCKSVMAMRHIGWTMQHRV